MLGMHGQLLISNGHADLILEVPYGRLGWEFICMMVHRLEKASSYNSWLENNRVDQLRKLMVERVCVCHHNTIVNDLSSCMGSNAC